MAKATGPMASTSSTFVVELVDAIGPDLSRHFIYEGRGGQDLFDETGLPCCGSRRILKAGCPVYLEHTYVCLPSNDSITQKCDRLFTKRTQKIVICVTIQVYLLS